VLCERCQSELPNQFCKVCKKIAKPMTLNYQDGHCIDCYARFIIRLRTNPKSTEINPPGPDRTALTAEDILSIETIDKCIREGKSSGDHPDSFPSSGSACEGTD